MSGHDPRDHKATLLHYLRTAREAVVWKLDGLSEYDVRRPIVATGSNLLGLVKHLAFVEANYFGNVFGRPMGVTALSWESAADDPTADLWARDDESREHVVDLYGRAAAHADATIERLDLDAPGRVPWWREGHQDVTLQHVLVHVLAETHRHAGHADILRELVDGAAGLRPDNENLALDDRESWAAYRERLERIAAEFR